MSQAQDTAQQTTDHVEGGTNRVRDVQDPLEPAAETAPETKPAEPNPDLPDPLEPEAKPEATDQSTTPEATDQSTTPEPDKAEEAAPAIVVPEGTEADKGLMDGVTSWMQERGIKQEDAQALADVFFSRQKELLAEAEQARDNQRRAWISEIEKDPALGGKNLEQTLLMAKKALVAFGGEDVQKLIDDKVADLDVHPSFIRMLNRIGQGLAEDTIAGSAAKRTGGEMTDEQRYQQMFPGQSPEFYATRKRR